MQRTIHTKYEPKGKSIIKQMRNRNTASVTIAEPILGMILFIPSPSNGSDFPAETLLCAGAQRADGLIDHIDHQRKQDDA